LLIVVGDTGAGAVAYTLGLCPAHVSVEFLVMRRALTYTSGRSWMPPSRPASIHQQPPPASLPWMIIGVSDSKQGAVHRAGSGCPWSFAPTIHTR
jgi:hypothetical protein